MLPGAGHHDIDVACRQRSALHLPHAQFVLGSEAREIALELSAREARVEQCADEHVAPDAGEQVEVQHLCAGLRRGSLPGAPCGSLRSGATSPHAQSRLMSVAT